MYYFCNRILYIISVMRKFALLIVALFLVKGLGATTHDHIVVTPLVGEEKVYYYNQIGRIVFTPQELQLISHAGELLGSDKRENVQKIAFVSGVGSAVENIASTDVRIYSDPTNHALIIEGLSDATRVRVYSVDGKCMMTTNANSGHSVVSVGNIPAGVYLLQVNTQIVKFIKQ